MLRNKKILLGVTGGIAAYKTANLIREFRKAGASVRVVMTNAATYFISPVTLSALSEGPVIADTFPDLHQWQISSDTWHITLGEWADIFLIAPATANTIAKIAYGVADNPVTIMALSIRCPIVISPAMDTFMWENKATQENISKLIQRGISVLEPEVGELASGLKGKGRLPELKSIVKSVDEILKKQKMILKGKKILVTAGPTYEPIDPVRFIGNRSSGKMGFAIARASAKLGADVTLITGPTTLETPMNVKRINIETADEMFKYTKKYMRTSDVIIMSAAVSDFKPIQKSKRKIKKENLKEENLTIELKKNPDILEYLGKHKLKNQILVGFALETENEIEYARKKLKNKNLDFIVVNNPLLKGAGFGYDTNIITLIDKKGKIKNFKILPKELLAEKLMSIISEKLLNLK